MSQWWGWDGLALDEKMDCLHAELQTADINTVLLLQVVTGLALHNERVNIAIDDLIKAIGWEPYDAAQREQMRLSVWRWLLIIEASEVVGQRKGKYKDRDTGKQLLTEFWEPFIRLTGSEYEGGREQRDDKTESPLRVSFVAGDTLNKYRDNRGVLSDVGDVLQIARLSRGKPSGAWACAISLALNQLWRINAKHARPCFGGSVKFSRYFTRAELLGMYRVTSSVDSILNGPNPRRAAEYWDSAIAKLERLDLIGHYEETGRKLPSISARSKDDYQYWFCEQPLDIRPGPETAIIVLEVAQLATRARKSARSHKVKNTSGKGNNSPETVANSLETVANLPETVAEGHLSPASKELNSLNYEIVKRATGFAVAQPSPLTVSNAVKELL